MIQIKYSTDWNNKLQCPVHTTLRLKNDLFKRGIYVQELLLKGKEEINLGTAEIIEIYKFKFADIPTCVALTDTGQDIYKFKATIKTIYKNKEIDWENQIFYWIWLKKK
jgi:hypothetical protein